MTVPVRPPVWPPAPSIQPGRTDARLTAQKAFFEAARAAQATTVAKAADIGPSPRAGAAQATKPVAQTAADAAAERLPRPGSILDIRV